jgi:hypothetical protein
MAARYGIGCVFSLPLLFFNTDIIFSSYLQFDYIPNTGNYKITNNRTKENEAGSRCCDCVVKVQSIATPLFLAYNQV